MKAGAIEFLTNPFPRPSLLDAVNAGLARDRRAARERAIMIQVVSGRLNKQIAGEIRITETTVKVHRST